MIPRHNWLLLFLGADGGTFETDQVRAMKGLFLLSQVPGHPAANLYEFEPYDYGPFDSQVYRDLDALRREGLLQVIEVSGSTRRRYLLTDEGRWRFEELRSDVLPEHYAEVVKVKRHVTSLGFSQLLDDIYCRFPQFRDRSVARVAHQG